MSFKEQIKGQKVLLFGLGLQGGGLGDAIWLHQNGAILRITDQKSTQELSASLSQLPTDISLTLGRHSQEDIHWADIILKNPGVPDDQSEIVLAKKLGKPILTSIAIVVAEGKDKVVAVTGTRGKSTTTEIIYQLLLNFYPEQVEKGGNIPSTSGLPLLDKLESLRYIVLELSSFQLHSFHDHQVSPHIAVITNMYPDHLNRYSSMDTYFADKAAITQYQTQSDIVIYNSGNDYATKLALLSVAQKSPYKADIVPSDWQMHLVGAHNLENIAAVIVLSQKLGIEIDQVKKIIENFHGLPFRLEKRRVLRGVTYINDTTSTTPTSTIKALEAISSPTILILGGADKKLPTNSLIAALTASECLKGIILLGSSQIEDFVKDVKDKLAGKIIGQVFSMDDAVKLAKNNATAGDKVLLSPGFSSFDLFDNEFDRGIQFNDAVSSLT